MQSRNQRAGPLVRQGTTCTADLGMVQQFAQEGELRGIIISIHNTANIRRNAAFWHKFTSFFVTYVLIPTPTRRKRLSLQLCRLAILDWPVLVSPSQGIQGAVPVASVHRHKHLHSQLGMDLQGGIEAWDQNTEIRVKTTK